MLETLQFTEQEQRQIAAVYPHLSHDEALHSALNLGLKSYPNRGPQKSENVLNFNRRRSDFVTNYQRYEDGKRLLESRNLSVSEYEKAVKKLAQDLGI